MKDVYAPIGRVPRPMVSEKLTRSVRFWEGWEALQIALWVFPLIFFLIMVIWTVAHLKNTGLSLVALILGDDGMLKSALLSVMDFFALISL